ncbi:MAG: DUF4349 domain-containing protein [Spirochaetales bacterium]|jgi:hypothetical protein|nr:DUF4349 domain-containing protein [Spirochaetales bacterium]
MIQKIFTRASIIPVLCAAVLLAGACSKAGYEAAAAGMESGGLGAYASGRLASPEQQALSRETARSAYDEAAEQSPAGENSSPENAFPQNTRKLVYTASLRLRVTNLEEAEKPVQAALEKYKGYAARTSAREDARYYTLRVPAPSYEAFLADLSPLGTVLYREESVDDVTLQYYDLEGRLTTKKTLLATYQNYLGKAKNIAEILSVEPRIADVQNDIDSLGSRLKTLADTADYATIELSLLLPASVDPSYKPGIGERIGELFGSFGGFMKTALIFIVGFLVYGIPALALAAFAYWLLVGRLGLLRHLWRLIAGKAAITNRSTGGNKNE